MRRSRYAIALLLLVGVVALVGAGCGGDEDESTPPAATTETETMPTETATTGEDTMTGEETTGGETGDAENGKQVFASAGCGSCHTFSAAGTSGSVGPNLDDASPSFDKVVDRVTNGGGAMPPFEDQLSEQEIRDVAAFVSGS